MHELQLILVAVLGIAVLLFLVIRVKLQAFLALIVVALLVGLFAGMPVTKVLDSVRDGMGDTLGFVAVVVGLGAIFGALLELSGGIENLARTLIEKLGEERAQWALGLAGFIIAIPVFFDVAFVILVPLLYGLSDKTRRSLLYYGIPMLAGLVVTHSFIPPTPGPIAVAELLQADLGWVILFGAIAGFPAMVIAGPMFGKYIAKKIHATTPEHISAADLPKLDGQRPGIAQILFVVLLPLVLILCNTLTAVTLPEDNAIRQVFAFLGHPFTALVISTLLALAYLRRIGRFDRQTLQNVTTKALEPAGIIILITGAGGSFKQVLIDSGVGQMLGNLMASSTLPPLLLAFIIAVVVRVSQGSATVAMITAAGLMAPLVETMQFDGPMLGLMVIAVAAGSTVLSHVNDSGFWLVSRYMGLSERDTLRSWTVMSSIVSLVGFGVALVISIFI